MISNHFPILLAVNAMVPGPHDDEDYDLSVQSPPYWERLVWIGNDECLLLCDMGCVKRCARTRRVA